MSLESHVTRLRKVSDALALATYPEDGAYVHGLLIEGARWTDEEESSDSVYTESGVSCAGYLIESKLKHLLEVMPILYVKAVPVQPHWSPECVELVLLLHIK